MGGLHASPTIYFFKKGQKNKRMIEFGCPILKDRYTAISEGWDVLGGLHIITKGKKGREGSLLWN